MLPLPQIPDWRPDELVGNVLTDIVDANSLGSKYVLMKWLGFTRSERNAQIMDINVLTPTWVKLAEKLGIGLKDLVETLSTKPYWACFHTRRRMSNRILNANAAELRVPEPVLIEQSRTRSELQLCPDCLREDSRAAGIPYVHRSHQLPGTFVCHKHRRILFHRCPACGKVLVPHLDLVRVSTKCECGCDLTKGTSVGKATAIYKLALFEHKCLYSTHPPRPGREVISFISQTCRMREVSMQALAVSTFGDYVNQWRGLHVGRTLDQTLRLQNDGMPALCACLVALGFDYAAAHEAMEQTAMTPKPLRDIQKLCRPHNTVEARNALVDLMRSSESFDWQTLRRKSRFVFWHLFLTDRPLLEEQLGTPRWNAVASAPSIEEDRQTILNGSSFHESLQAKARAHCRDKVWLEQRKLTQGAARIEARDDKLEGSIRTAMKEAYASSGRPVKFTRRRAASAAGLSLVGVEDLDRRRQSNEGPLWESATHYRCRLLIWALERRVARGARLTPNFLIKEAGGMERRFMQRFYAASIIYLFGPDAASDQSG